jgi:hypothetical protein
LADVREHKEQKCFNFVCMECVIRIFPHQQQMMAQSRPVSVGQSHKYVTNVSNQVVG